MMQQMPEKDMTKFKNEMIHFDDETQNNSNCSCFHSQIHVYKKKENIKAIQTWFSGYINTLEGIMRFSKGDYLAEDINGEHYPIKKEIFEKTYELFDTTTHGNCS